MDKEALLKVLKYKKNGSILPASYKDIEADIVASTPWLVDVLMPERIYCILNEITSPLLCECGSGKPLTFNNGKEGYFKTCSKSCKLKTAKRNESLLGVAWTPERREKVRSTVQERHGVDNPFQTEAAKRASREAGPRRNSRILESVEKKYGVKSVFQLPDVKKKADETCIAKYGHRRHNWQDLPPELFDADWLIDAHHTRKMNVTGISQELGISVDAVVAALIRLGIERVYYSESSLEVGMREFLDSVGVEYVQGSKMILPDHMQLDFYIPGHKLAIEMNGLYWHSTKFRDRNYHATKLKMCEELGIRLVQVFEDEWVYHREKCMASIKHILGLSERGVYARKAEISEISWEQARAFLDKHHLQNAGTPGDYRIGAFHAGVLIAVMVFGEFRNESLKGDHGVEMKRFVTDGRNHPGLGSKMTKYAFTHRGYSKMIAFVDRRWFHGSFKTASGFTPASITEPGLWYCLGNKRFHRTSVKKEDFIKTEEDRTKTKIQLLEESGYYVVYDAGKIKMELCNETGSNPKESPPSRTTEIVF